jgi:hypothetical protein
MRLNVYSQELTPTKGPHIELITKVAEETVDGVPLLYSAVRMYLESPERLHYAEGDDDRSAITFWLPKSKGRREQFALILEALAQKVREAPAETGLD